MKALNLNENRVMISHAHDLANLGVGAVLVYLRTDRTSKAQIDGFKAVEPPKGPLKVGMVYEMGWPTTASYFTIPQAEHDAAHAVAVANLIGAPHGAQIFTAVDFDATESETRGPIAGYQTKFRSVVRDAGYLASVYGSGMVCRILTQIGIAHAGWLSGSTGWAEYEEYKPKAAIIQGKSASVFGFDVDWDEVVDPEVVW